MLRRLKGLMGVSVCLAVAVAATTLATPSVAAGRHASSGIVLKIKNPTKESISSGFVGLTFEATTLGRPYLDPAQSNLPFYLAELGHGNLRFGGQTSDLNAFWQSDPSVPLPAWADSAVTPSELATVGSLARATGWSTDLGVNLLHFDPAAAANEVQAAQSALGSSLHAVELGNEPDLYFYEAGLVAGTPTTFPAYVVNWNAYQAAIKAVDPGVSISGPDFYLTYWLSSFNKKNEQGLSDFTQHFYPQADCGGTTVSPAQLVSQTSITSEDSLIAVAKSAAKKGHHPLVLDEFNSISCGSTSPAAWEFASSLWAVHALLQAASDGVASVNIQMNPSNCQSYTPLCVPDPAEPGTVQARPIFSGMQLVSSLEGGTLLKTSNSSAQKLPDGVSDYAVRLSTGNVAVVVINSSSTDVAQLSLQLDASARVVSIQQLQAPSLDATDGVTLATSAPTSGAPTELSVPANSATVFTLAP
jgi:hypothetical protein